MEDQQSHTAGPWETDGLTIQDDSGIHTIAECSEWLPEFRAERLANARLIAAAPDLLEALELILPLAKGYAPEGQTATARATCRSWIEAAEAAITKAVKS